MLIPTQLKKQTLKKLIKDTCSKAVFSVSNKLCQQIDGFGMGSSLAPVLANIALTEMEKTNEAYRWQDLIVCGRYVNDILVAIK